MELIKNSFRKLIDILVPHYMAFLIQLILITPIRFFVKTYQGELIASTVVFVIALSASTFIIFKRQGEKLADKNDYKYTNDVISLVIADVIYIVITILTGYYNVGITVPALDLGKIILGIESKYDAGFADFTTTYKEILILSVSILTALNIPISIIGYRYGKKERIMSRNAMMGKENG